MNETAGREKVLKNIRNASLVKVANKYSGANLEADIYKMDSEDDLLIRFAQELNAIGGSFVYCENEDDLIQNLKVLLQTRNTNSIFSTDRIMHNMLKGSGINLVEDESKSESISIGLTRCEALVARLGSVLVSSKHDSGRKYNFSPDLHIVIAQQSQVVETVKDALAFVREKYAELPSMLTLITGPSRTADIEKTLVMGAHGPRELIVFVLDIISHEY
ncbi:MAG: hypothetical protein AUJ98_08820 [Bacteroidetes bacterium CG2_30_33_31]|nr:MAG: hypothetical protein AUJ98_08820 [Bacteroidetes bacterium CG2_30_33_31]